MKLVWGAYGLGGHMTRKLIPALKDAKGSHLKAVGHYKLAVAKAVADKLGVNTAYGSLEDLLQDSEIQAVVIASPTDLHYEHGKATLLAGKHLLLEKPMTLKVEHAKELCEIAVSKKVALGVGFHLRHHPVLVEMHRRIAAGEIGEPLFLQASFGKAHPWPGGTWWTETERSGPQVLMGYGVHALDLCRWMLDADFSDIYASLLWEPVNTFSVVHLDMTTKARCSVMCSTAIKYIPNTIEVMGRDGRLVGAGAVTTSNAGKLLRSTGDHVKVIDVDGRDPYTAEFEAFQKAVEEGTPFRANGLDGLRVVRAQVAITESAETGCAVSIPEDAADRNVRPPG